MDDATLSPELRPGATPPKPAREPRGLRRARGRDRGTGYPGSKPAGPAAGGRKWCVSMRVAGAQEASPGRWRVRIRQARKQKQSKQPKNSKPRKPVWPAPAEARPAAAAAPVAAPAPAPVT